jgi:hypothetical protein
MEATAYFLAAVIANCNATEPHLRSIVQWEVNNHEQNSRHRTFARVNNLRFAQSAACGSLSEAKAQRLVREADESVVRE